jgi:hypothetical protein
MGGKSSKSTKKTHQFIPGDVGVKRENEVTITEKDKAILDLKVSSSSAHELPRSIH